MRDQLAALSGRSASRSATSTGAHQPDSIYALPRDGALGFVIGGASAARSQAPFRHAAALPDRRHYLCHLAHGRAQPGRGRGARVRGAGCGPLPPAARRRLAGLAALRKSVRQGDAAQTRRALPELLRALPDGGAGIEASCSAALTRTRRLALLLSGELEPALREASETGDHEAGADLLRAWLGGALTAARRKLGLAQ